METSESIKCIALAMNKAQASMTAAKKGAKNPFFKSSYADLGSIVLALKEAFADNGLSYIQSPGMDELGISVTTMIMHESGEWIKGTLHVPMAKKDPQGAGSAITYARRYALQAMVGLPSADDDAEFAMGRNTEKKPDLISKDQAEQINAGMLMADISEADLCRVVRINSIKELQASRFSGAMSYLKSQAESK